MQRTELIEKLKTFRKIESAKAVLNLYQTEIEEKMNAAEQAKGAKMPYEPTEEDFEGIDYLYRIAVNAYTQARWYYENSRGLVNRIDYLKQEAQYAADSLRKINLYSLEYEDIFPSRHMDRLDEVIDILEEMRADTVKEAINVLLQDDQVRKLYEALEQQKVLMDQHLSNLRAKIESQSEMIEQQSELIESQNEMFEQQNDRLFCRHCKNNLYCTHRKHPRYSCDL